MAATSAAHGTVWLADVAALSKKKHCFENRIDRRKRSVARNVREEPHANFDRDP
jgi:hypothetical protein